jgi:hypothetical protein
MSTPPGSYADMAALDAASVPNVTGAAATTPPFESQTQLPGITWGVQGQPSLAVRSTYVTLTDNAVFTCVNSVAGLTTISAYLRILRPDGTIMTQILTINNPTSNRTPNQAVTPLPEGLLIAVMVAGNNVTLSRGQCYVNVFLQRNLGANTPLVEMLVADYLTTFFAPTWPGGVVKSATEGQGYITTYLSAVPTGSNAPTLTQPAGTRWRVISAQATLTAGSSVGGRICALEVLNGAQLVGIFSAATLVNASQNANITFGPGLALVPSLGQPQGIQSAPMPADYMIANGYTLTILEFTGGASDVWSAMAVQVEEWIDV